MPRDPDCVFCQIVADTGKCLLLAEDPEALAFMDIHPANPGHCLVIPKGHWPTVFDIPSNAFASVGRLVVRVAAGVQQALRPPGLSLVQANGPAANQTVAHLHVHVLPRQRDDSAALELVAHRSRRCRSHGRNCHSNTGPTSVRLTAAAPQVHGGSSVVDNQPEFPIVLPWWRWSPPLTALRANDSS
jgi:histidine triad (HIT) family protein